MTITAADDATIARAVPERAGSARATYEQVDRTLLSNGGNFAKFYLLNDPFKVPIANFSASS